MDSGEDTKKKNDTFKKWVKPYIRLFCVDFKTFVLLCFLAMSLSLRHRIDSYVCEQAGGQLTSFYYLLNRNSVVNWIIVLLFVGVGIYVSRRILKQRTYSWLIIISAFIISYFLIDDDWEWAKICYFVNYKWLIITILLSFLVCGVYLLISRIKNTPNLKEKDAPGTGFSVTTDTRSLQDTGWEQYADNLVGKLLKTNIKSESFAVGISGEWGSGKTTFLKAIKDKLKGKVYLIEFNPWNSDSALQISNDFFNCLVSSLVISSYERRSITRYAKLLSQLNSFGTKANFIASILDDPGASLEEAKKKAAGVIDSMPLPVVVLIDDLDRLDGSELMAVLRLVRVTANFMNLIFVVAYDKEYVTQVLSGGGVNKGDEFLKKIFPLEVCLPAFESFVIANHLYSELKTCLDNESILKQLTFCVFRCSVSHPISHYLPTFRDVKRFVNQFSLNINSFIRAKQIEEIDVPDFFMLELLHYYDFNAYQQIQNKPLTLLDYGYNIHNKYAYGYRQVGSVKGSKSLEEQDERREKILARFKDGVPDLLWSLFGNSSALRGENRLRYPTNFTKYFSYRINKDVISLEEFRKFIDSNTKETVEEKVKEYCQGDVSKRASLKHHLSSLVIDKNNKKQAYNVAYALLELALYRGIDPGSAFKVMFDRSKFKELGIVPESLIEAIRDHIGKENSWYIIQEILTALVEVEIIDYADDGGGHIEYASVLNWEQLKALAEENFISALNGRKIPVQLITDVKSRFHDFLSKAVARVAVGFVDGENDEVYSKSLLLDKLREIYSTRDNKVGMSQFFKNLDPHEDDYQLDEEDYMHFLDINISSVFGSTYKNQSFYVFIEEAFSAHIPEVNGWLKRLRLTEIPIDKKEIPVDAPTKEADEVHTE